MYLARLIYQGKRCYIIRQSYVDDGHMKSRDLFDLGDDPTRHIVYVGGNGFYYTDELLDGIAQAGTNATQEQLDELLFDFLKPSVQRVIEGFDRSYQRSSHIAVSSEAGHLPPPHPFDKRRLCFLRFGRNARGRIDRLPEKFFRRLYAKSRDELEQYFLYQESFLKPHERPVYLSEIFNLNRFVPESRTDLTLLDQMDAFFISQLCRLDQDERFWAGMHHGERLHDYLVKYAIMHFDALPQQRPTWQAYAQEFINQHRTYHPPARVKIKLEEAGRLFGLPWKKLKTLDPSSLARLYRRLALRHHPDRGGDSDTFRRLTQYYQVLRKRKR